MMMGLNETVDWLPWQECVVVQSCVEEGGF